MSEGDMDELTRLLRDQFNPPPPTPRDEMWAVIQAGMQAGAPLGEDPQVLSLEQARARRSPPRWNRLAWAAAAAAVLGLGVGIGRVTAPPSATVAEIPVSEESEAVLRVAAREHLGRTEALLRMVRADGQAGHVDPAMGEWARVLLTQTRLYMDRPVNQDPSMHELLEDLELVLVQVVAVSEAQGVDSDRARSELSLALSGMEQREVLPRIQAVVPSGTGLAGT